MILGSIVGRVLTTKFTFLVEKQVKLFDYVQVHHPEHGYVLCQVVELTRDEQKTLAKSRVIGYVDQNQAIKTPRDPFHIGNSVLRAQDELISSIVKLEAQKGALLGTLENRDIEIRLDLQKLLTKHIAVLAKSGAGKSYSVGVLLEEIIEQQVPLLIIDPHGEYHTLLEKNTQQAQQLAKLGLKPKAYKNVQLFGDIKTHPSYRALTVPNTFDAQELLQLLPVKLSPAQESLIYATIKQLDTLTLDSLQVALESEESPAKWAIIQLIDQLRDYGIFSHNALSYNELIRPGVATIIDLKGYPPHVQQVLVFKLLKDLFWQRKQDLVAPFFCVIEEAHNFCPERNFGQSVSSDVLRTIASEGRKFGMGLCVVSQRPARVDKSVLSQVSTQIILKVTNPNDLRAISQSVEGITSESENQIQNLPIGHALVTGVVDVPLFVQVRPRMTKHGGDSVQLVQKPKDFLTQLNSFEKKSLLPVIQTGISDEDAKMMYQHFTKLYIPCVLLKCADCSLLFDRTTGKLITGMQEYVSAKLPQLDQLSSRELTILKQIFTKKQAKKEDFYSLGFDAGTILEALEKKQYICQENGVFVLSNMYVLHDLKQYSLSPSILMQEVGSFEKPVISIDEIKKQAKRFVDCQTFEECYLPVYKET
ncbi:MAG: ATP-binding protein [Candidatus Woesearchaeota archaeon]